MALIGNFDDDFSRSLYNHEFLAMQRPEVFTVFPQFIREEKPTLIVEFGTAFGGLAKCLFDASQEVGCKFITLDILHNESNNELFKYGVDFRLVDVFMKINWKLWELHDDFKEELLSYPPPIMVLCDGGNKIGEYNGIAPILRSGDILMAHDFAYDDQAFADNLQRGVWGWKEITNEYIEQSMIQYGYRYYRTRTFEPLAWGCTKKM